ncbi:MerR family transcriptional regulator [Schleiferia thermophila]|jgi:DNA-binding transcriptional MerR regulator|uniref:MerR family transcriptional regulator n=1 Tax=Schleiferia thermophila TaxID=884107 RepID=UPI0004E7554A|nr:MerR family transcriptional regulator [Schleiferia thermophila]KFD39143.1 transcriptional regulator [Schleiferia thermophila str. Yellowstone]PMB31590.1 transcriptional regulator [Fischerella thermalis CCMEE 5319]
MKDKTLQFKRYYTMGEVTEMLGVNPSLIRFWHKEFSEYIQPKTNKKGNRLFTPKDVETIRKIYHLVKENGYTLEGAKKALKDKSTEHLLQTQYEDDSKELIRNKLLKIREELLKIKDLL